MPVKNTAKRDSSIDSFKHLVLKPFASFWPFSGVQDYFCNILALQLGLDAPLCRPVLVFLNGEYWGIYFIQEKMDERFLEDHHDINPDSCNIISNWKGALDHGSNLSFRQMMNWFRNADLRDDANYEYACSLIDMQNFIDYYVFQTFVNNKDWPGNNMRCWQEGDGPWQWIFFDGDAAIYFEDFDVFACAATYFPPSTWLNYPEAKLVFGKLLDNEQFRIAFTERAQELCNGLFTYEYTFPIFHDMVETLRPKIGEQRHRFGYPPSDAVWNNGNNIINAFLEHRVDRFLSAMNNFLTTWDLEELLSDSRQLYCFPNPTNGNLWIQIPDNDRHASELVVYDVRGIVVHREPLPLGSGSHLISTQLHLSAGLYLIKIGNHTQQIIVQ